MVPCGPCTTASQIVIPNVMGLVLYQPAVAVDTGVSAKSEAFCKSLVSLYRINFFDQLVYHDQDVKIEQTRDETSDEGLTLFFKLCSAAGAGNLEEVRGGGVCVWGGGGLPPPACVLLCLGGSAVYFPHVWVGALGGSAIRSGN